MTKYRYEFELNDFEKGDCDKCHLSYQEYYNRYECWDDICVLGYNYDECPLEEVKGGAV